MKTGRFASKQEALANQNVKHKTRSPLLKAAIKTLMVKQFIALLLVLISNTKT
jgi:uncharacterized membrane protein YsdA (DUF1294 family)